MASSSAARSPLLCLLLLPLVALLLLSPVAASEPFRARAPPPAVAAWRALQDFRVAVPAPSPDAGMAWNGAWTRPIRRRRRERRGGGTGAWAFSAMLPRGFVPPSGSSACHNDMPATAADAQFFTCGGSAYP